MPDQFGFVCPTCGLSDYGRKRMLLNGFNPHPCRVCEEHFAMPHPHMPDPIPDIPEHVIPTGPDDMEQRLGVVYCVRCGRPMTKIETGEPMSGRLKPCVRVEVALRAAWDTGVVNDDTIGSLFDA